MQYQEARAREMNPEKRGSKYKGVHSRAGHIYTTKCSWVLSDDVYLSRNCMETLLLGTVHEREGKKKREVVVHLLHIYSFILEKFTPMGH